MKIQCHDFYGNLHTIDESKLIDHTSVYGVYIQENKKVLLILDPRSKLWEIPGGGVEDGESDHDALKREVLEETGQIILEFGALITQWYENFFDTTRDEAWRSYRKYYLIKKIEGKLLTQGNNDDSREAKYIDVNKLNYIKTASSVAKVLDLTI